MSISVRLNEEDTKLIKKYAELNKLTVSEFIRQTIIEKIEDEYDLKCYEKALEENKKTPGENQILKSIEFSRSFLFFNKEFKKRSIKYQSGQIR